MLLKALLPLAQPCTSGETGLLLLRHLNKQVTSSTCTDQLWQSDRGRFAPVLTLKVQLAGSSLGEMGGAVVR